MIIDDLDFVGITTLPNEANSPLLVDANTVLTLSVAAQSFQVV
jgi:hypothetical protein